LNTNSFSAQLNKVYKWEVLEGDAAVVKKAPLKKPSKVDLNKQKSNLQVPDNPTTPTLNTQKSVEVFQLSPSVQARIRKAKFLMGMVNAVNMSLGQAERSKIKMLNVGPELLMKEMEASSDYGGLNNSGSAGGESAAAKANRVAKRVSEGKSKTLMLRLQNDFVDIEQLLSEQDWVHESAEVVAQQLGHELMALESANVHAIIQAEEQSQQVLKMLDQTMAELDKVEQWVNKYYTALSLNGQDIRNLETQNKGLQIETVNQKLLLAELNQFVDRLHLDDRTERVLLSASWETAADIQSLRDAFTKLREVIQRLPTDEKELELRAVRDQATFLYELSETASKRFVAFLTQLISVQIEFTLQDEAKSPQSHSLKLDAHEEIFDATRQYRDFIMWIREMRPAEFETCQQNYCQQMQKVFQKEIRELINVFKSHYLHKPDKDVEDGALFAPATSKYLSILSALTGQPVPQTGITSKVTQLLSKP
jgi:hypothetical protein